MHAFGYPDEMLACGLVAGCSGVDAEARRGRIGHEVGEALPAGRAFFMFLFPIGMALLSAGLRVALGTE